jgi:hypothetical protein
MRLNDDGHTVAAMDMLVPRVGELMGGSQREERADVRRSLLPWLLLPSALPIPHFMPREGVGTSCLRHTCTIRVASREMCLSCIRVGQQI